MRRKLPLVILAAVTVATTVALTVRSAAERRAERVVPATGADSQGRQDAAAVADAAPAEDRPCVAAHLGLPCR